nr:HAD family hydrolase [Cellulomonas sp. PhB143]
MDHGRVRRAPRARRRAGRDQGAQRPRPPAGHAHQRLDSVADSLLGRAGVREHFERLLSVEDARRWKPAPEAYAYGVEACGVDAAQAMLVAVHPWDIDGAARAGLATAWIDRSGGHYPGCFTPPDLRVASVTDLAERLR